MPRSDRAALRAIRQGPSLQDWLIGAVIPALGGFASRAWRRRRAWPPFEDPLTGLPDRHRFEEALKVAIDIPPRAGATHAVLLVELSGRTAIDDATWIEMARRLRLAVRVDDLIARWDGGSFAILSRHVAGPEAATGLVLRLLAAVEEMVPADGGRHGLGIAIGVTLFPQDGSGARDLIRKAGIALGCARRDGRHAIRFHQPAMDTRLRERERLEADLRAAIGTPALRPYYQPRVDLRSGAILGFEALARWHHPERGEVTPDRFIPIADDAGLIGALGDHLLRQAVADARLWPGEIPLAFNLSPVELADPGLAPRILAILAEAGLPPRRLELELSEGALAQDLAAVQSTLAPLRAAGVRIALDDFGAGDPSLHHLRSIRPDRIKIDRSLVGTMGRDREAAAIVGALIGLGAGLGLAITAEGVADEAERTLLIGQGCSEAQGFLFGRAVPAAEALALLLRPGLGDAGA